MNILLTGGAGYIGSHTVIELINAGYNVIIYDNLSNSSIEVIKRVEKIVGQNISFQEGDIRDKTTLQQLFSMHDIDAVIHFAGLKAVGESVKNPLKYYDNNINGTLTLLEVMKEFECKKIVFSSSATVYGTPKQSPIQESFSTGNTTNPYGKTKYLIEGILEDLSISDKSWEIVILRYFNPIGAHQSGMIGEDPSGVPNNLMPYISQVAVGQREYLNIFGGDYDTSDGTGVRDYIHVCDLANGHVKAIDFLQSTKQTTPLIINLGTGVGYSVLQVLNTFEKINNVKIPYKITQRRKGDVAECFADSNLAKEILGWEAKNSLEKMCEDSWRWQKKNPTGYR